MHGFGLSLWSHIGAVLPPVVPAYYIPKIGLQLLTYAAQSPSAGPTPSWMFVAMSLGFARLRHCGDLVWQRSLKYKPRIIGITGKKCAGRVFCALEVLAGVITRYYCALCWA